MHVRVSSPVVQCAHASSRERPMLDRKRAHFDFIVSRGQLCSCVNCISFVWPFYNIFQCFVLFFFFFILSKIHINDYIALLFEYAIMPYVTHMIMKTKRNWKIIFLLCVFPFIWTIITSSKSWKHSKFKFEKKKHNCWWFSCENWILKKFHFYFVEEKTFLNVIFSQIFW